MRIYSNWNCCWYQIKQNWKPSEISLGFIWIGHRIEKEWKFVQKLCWIYSVRWGIQSDSFGLEARIERCIRIHSGFILIWMANWKWKISFGFIRVEFGIKRMDWKGLKKNWKHISDWLRWNLFGLEKNFGIFRKNSEWISIQKLIKE